MEKKPGILNVIVGILVGLLIGAGASVLYFEPKVTNAQTQTAQTGQNSSGSSNTSPQSSSGNPTSQSSSTSNQSTQQIQKQSETPALSNAVVNSKSGSEISVSKDGKTYSVNTDSATTYARGDASTGSLSEIGTNNLITIYGSFSSSATNSINATEIKDLSLQEVSLSGTVSSVDMNNQTLVIENSEYGKLTVYANSNSAITDKNGKNISINSINVGDTITLSGVLDNSNNLVISTTNIADLNIAL